MATESNMSYETIEGVIDVSADDGDGPFFCGYIWVDEPDTPEPYFYAVDSFVGYTASDLRELADKLDSCRG